ncbi:DUF3310 domain-containing protein [Staphylococcus pseudoxylosus]|uniref:DUF3310 domain-containing protein n=1 Tax=Staphylococcus pseudoxylosus TaxID=2282419 RepID=UPI002DBC6ED5|nr:DUF3310 domain-containing protein [Staphylococcus pseudoxylosus]MEB6059567.1 DUF3310 domain-containing protein [Staphylococcus pseudoxylosus]
MKIRDLNLDDYVIVYDIGKSENSEGMTVVGKVIELEFRGDDDNMAIVNSLGNEYFLTDNNYFDLWSNYIESKTESLSENVLKAGLGISKPATEYKQSNDVQQRKRNDTVNHPSHYNYGEIEVIDFIEQVTQHYNPNVAYHIGNAIKYLARSPHKNGKEDVAKAKWYIERAYENWDVK